METLLGLVVAAAVLLALPFLLVAGVFWLVFQLVALPFRLLGVVLKGVTWAGIAVVKLVAAVVSLVGLLVFGLLLPLLPFVIVGGGLWLLFRAARPAPSTPIVTIR